MRNYGLLLTETGDGWPQWEWLRRYQHWNRLVPELYEECEALGRPITTYYADNLVAIARLAIPAINELERSDSDTEP